MTPAWPAVLAAMIVVALGSPLGAAPTRPITGDVRPPGIANRGSVTWSGGRRAIRMPWARRVRTSGPAEVARWCDEVARAVRSGHSLRAALLTPTCDPGTTLGLVTGRLALLLERGVDPARALRRVGEDLSPDDPIGAALLVAAVAARLGGAIAVPLDRVAAALRVRAADEAERSAQSAQARLSAHVLTVVPAGFLVLTAGVDADVRAVVTSVPGAPIVVAGMTLDLLGGWWMRRIVRGRRP